MKEIKKYLPVIILFLCLIFNYSAQARDVEVVFTFSKATTLRTAELLDVPSSETPAPEVTIYYPRVNFSSGKSKQPVLDKNSYLNENIENHFLINLIVGTRLYFSVPVYLVNKVFRI